VLGGPLAGLRVIDLTQMLAGPFATMLLADLGADVIKVEPERGDLTREGGPYLPDDEAKAFGGYFQSVNRNKRSVVVDLKCPAGREVLLRLVAGADVCVENYRLGVMERLGVPYEVLREDNERLVYACVRGFGDPRTGESPYAHWPAFDVTAQAMGGLMGITGVGPGQPLKVGPGVGDIVPAMLMAFGILAAVRHAEHTGEGQLVDVAMYDGVLALCERIVYQYSYSGKSPEPQGNSHPLLCPFDAFPAKDGWVTIAAPTDSLWEELVDAIGRPELAGDDRFATNQKRLRHGDEVRALLGAWTKNRTKREVLEVLGGRVPCGPVNTAADIYADPHSASRQMLVEVEHPGSATPATICGVPVKLTRTPGGVRHRAPLLGEHTDEVLTEAGFDRSEIERLRKEGAVR
jgi:crotonobetainyl-CoA:carnitine CoA-transferase CaiB-like acyl-CoA transferase